MTAKRKKRRCSKQSNSQIVPPEIENTSAQPTGAQTEVVSYEPTERDVSSRSINFFLSETVTFASIFLISCDAAVNPMSAHSLLSRMPYIGRYFEKLRIFIIFSACFHHLKMERKMEEVNNNNMQPSALKNLASA